MSEQGDKARKALHDMRWGPHIESVVERQVNMDAAIKIALQAITTLEQRVDIVEVDGLRVGPAYVRNLQKEKEALEQRVERLEELQATPEELRLREHGEKHKIWHEGCALCG